MNVCFEIILWFFLNMLPIWLHALVNNNYNPVFLDNSEKILAKKHSFLQRKSPWPCLFYKKTHFTFLKHNSSCYNQNCRQKKVVVVRRGLDQDTLKISLVKQNLLTLGSKPLSLFFMASFVYKKVLIPFHR